MSLATVEAILEVKLDAIWNSRTVIHWDNTGVRPTSTHILTMLDQIGSKPMSLKCSRDEYNYTIDIFVPAGDGTGLVNEYSDDLVEGFKNYSTGYLICKSAISKRVGEEDGWFRRRVDIEVQFDDHTI